MDADGESGACSVDDDPTGDGALVHVTASARGWHGVQLAVLGFIGLCGVLQGAARDVGKPGWLQVAAAVLVLTALVLQCLAVGTVATVAWPLQQPAPGDRGGAADRVRRRLRSGIATTFVAVGVLALAAISSWWPSGEARSAQVRVETSRGAACGRLQEAPQGALALEVDGEVLTVALRDVARVQPVDSCG